MDDSKVFMFPDAAKSSGIDTGLLALLNQNGGFGGNNWIWILFLWFIYGGNWNGMGGNGNIQNQLFNSEGRDLLLQAINGRADALGLIAQITNTGVETVKNGIFALQNAINQVGTQVGMSGLEVQNAIALGNANLAQQICQCCCENKTAILNQTNALQAQAAANHSASQAAIAAHDANVRLQLAQNEAADQLSVCQQTNTLSTLAERNTNTIVKAIADQNAMIVDQFCQLKERELQAKINTQGDIITQLRNQISNDKLTEIFAQAFNQLTEKVNTLAAKSPNTVPVVYPNLTAINNTPYMGNYWGGLSYWG